METSFTHTKVPGVKYIAGITFQSEYGVHEAGSEVPEAEKFANLQVLVDAHFLYPYAPEEGYDWLPPHLFNTVRTRQEVLDKMAGDPTGPHINFEKTEHHEIAEKNAEEQEVIYAKLKATQQPGREDADPGPSPEEVAAEATGNKIEPRAEENTGLPVIHEEKPVKQTATRRRTRRKSNG